MVDRNISADVTLGPFAGPALLDDLNIQIVVAPVTYGRFVGAADIDLNKRYLIAANVTVREFTGAAVFDVFQYNQIEAACRIGPFSGLAELLMVPARARAEYAEEQDSHLLGAIDLAAGPGDTLLVGAGASRAVSFVVHNDPQRVYVAHSKTFAGRVLAVASTASYYFVLVEGTERPDPDGQPTLFVFPQTTFYADAVASLRLPRDINPRFLWAQRDGEGDPDIDFLVITGADGAIEIRAANPSLTLLAAQETGVYAPRVVEAVRQPDLETATPAFRERVWNILIFSERSARGFVLQYRDTLAVTTVQPALAAGERRLAASTQMNAFAMAADLTTP